MEQHLQQGIICSFNANPYDNVHFQVICYRIPDRYRGSESSSESIDPPIFDMRKF